MRQRRKTAELTAVLKRIGQKGAVASLAGDVHDPLPGWERVVRHRYRGTVRIHPQASCQQHRQMVVKAFISRTGASARRLRALKKQGWR